MGVGEGWVIPYLEIFRFIQNTLLKCLSCTQGQREKVVELKGVAQRGRAVKSKRQRENENSSVRQISV